MQSWYSLSLIALLLLGTQRFLYKVAAERGCSSSLTTTVFMATVSLLSLAAWLIQGADPGPWAVLVVLALVNSTSFAGATIANIEALKRLPAGVTFPLTRLSLVLVMLFSLTYFDERLQSLQWLGILLGLAAAFFLARDLHRQAVPAERNRVGLLFVLGGIVCGAVSSISCKFAALQTSKAGFMALTYLLATLFSLAINRRWSRKQDAGPARDAILIGLVMGLLNFFGFYALLAALEEGPLGIIVLITGMHFIVAIMLSVIIYRERLTMPRTLAIALTLVAVFFMKQ